MTFDGALHHLMGTCTYVLTRPCQSRSPENYIVSATNEFRGGNLEASYVRAVHVQVFNLRISLIKGHKVMVRASAHLPGPHTSSPLRASSLPVLTGAGPPVRLLEPLGVAHTRPSPGSAPILETHLHPCLLSGPGPCYPCPKRLSLPCPLCLYS